MRVCFETADGLRSTEYIDIPEKEIRPGHVYYRAIYRPPLSMSEDFALNEVKIEKRKYEFDDIVFDLRGPVAIYREIL